MKLISKKKSSLVSYELYCVKRKIYAVKVEDSYERAMLFLRYQEFYESPYKQFQGKHFDVWEFMNQYRKDRGTYFTYPGDWSGYNIPSDSFNKCIKGVFDVKVNTTPYDQHMFDIKWAITEDLKNYGPDPSKEKFYLIGVDRIKGDIMDHEIAHALFYFNAQYRKEMTTLVKDLPMRKYNGLTNILLDLGYRKKVVVDEIQAFLSTGLSGGMKRLKLEEDTLKFGEVFKRYADLS